MAAEGKLCVSVIEARNVQADTTSNLSFYVKLRVGTSQARQTDMVHNSMEPKFLKDLRLSVLDPDSDVLTVELLQQGLRGDLVIGKEQLYVASVMDKGTIVTWLPLMSMDGECAAEVCLVMRYLQANSSRPMTPSYAIAARAAKERAMVGTADPSLLDANPQVSRALFSDLAGSQAEQGSTDTPTKHTSTAGDAEVAPIAEPAPTIPAVTARATRSKPRHHGPLRAIGALLSLPGKVGSQAGKTNVPMPLAMACGGIVGALMYMTKVRTPLENPDYDAPCAVAACFRQDVYDRYRQRFSTF